MPLPRFYFSPKIFGYDFGPQHPLRPERLRRMLMLLEAMGFGGYIDSGGGDPEDVLRVHTEQYLNAVRHLSDKLQAAPELAREHGFYGDNPPFSSMYDAALAYVGASSAAARAVRDGASLAFGIGGGLHHARPNKASGFCIFNDPAIACHILRERFSRVAYIDIDVHHGDGVQWIFYEDPSVLTISIHEEGTTLYPGTGFADETGAEFTSLNLPMKARTSGDVWLATFEAIVPAAIDRFRPEAIVLQMGTDPHFLDPLGHLDCAQQHWLGAVARVRSFGVPIVALGGGGYNLTTVPRMWVSALLTLADVEFEDAIPPEVASELGAETFSDLTVPATSSGIEAAEELIGWLRNHHAMIA